MSIRVICYCSKQTLVPESFCGEHLTCSNCGQHYVLPERWRALGRPLLDLDLRPEELVSIHCECGNEMEVPVQHAGRRIACEDCGSVHGVPKYEIPESNAQGQDVEAVRTSINLQAMADAASKEAQAYQDDDPDEPDDHPDDDPAAWDDENLDDVPDALPPEDGDEDEPAVVACRRCKVEYYDSEPFCPECGAHPATGLTHPDAQQVWAHYQRGGSGVGGSGSPGRGPAGGRTGVARGVGGGRVGTGSIGRTRGSGATQRNRSASGGGRNKQSTSGSTRRPLPGSGASGGSGNSGAGSSGSKSTRGPRVGGPRARSGSHPRSDRRRGGGGGRSR